MFYNLSFFSIKAKIAVIANVICGFLIVIAILSVFILSTMERSMGTIYNDSVLPMKEWSQLRFHIETIKGKLYYHVAESDEERLTAIENEIDSLTRQINDLYISKLKVVTKNNNTVTDLSKIDLNKESLQNIQRLFLVEWQKLESDIKAITEMSKSYLKEDASNKLKTAFDSVDKVSDITFEKYIKNTFVLYQSSKKMNVNSLIIFIVISVLAVILSQVLSRKISLDISQKLAIINKSFEQIGAGNLTTQVTISSRIPDDLDITARLLNEMTQKLQEVLKLSITASAATNELIIQSNNKIQEITDNTDEINNNITNVSKAAENQVRNINEVLDEMKEILDVAGNVYIGTDQQVRLMKQSEDNINNNNTIVNQINDSSHIEKKELFEMRAIVNNMIMAIKQISADSTNAAQAAVNTSNIAQDGKNVLSDTLEGLTQIHRNMLEAGEKVHNLGEQSSKIIQIVEVIDDISGQTNLLALNAAIEAARAGEHGRGFAVVADEVRKLAEKAVKATKNISDLIKITQGEIQKVTDYFSNVSNSVKKEVEMANQTKEAFVNIVEGVNSITAQVQNISAASEELSASTSDVTEMTDHVCNIVDKNVNTMSDVVTNFAKLKESITETRTFSEQSKTMINELKEKDLHVNDKLGYILNISKDNSDYATSTNASMEEIGDKMKDIHKQMNDLSVISTELSKQVGIFTV
ncbi:MAG: hypothetical protein DKM50_08285 [Candidatus Margulisiibacteriota bacterium]|nr:MAG: hypothetical protein A2X43_03065 [Candidatus Margulisbacteria bacterium GWD2_39_127]PZM79593.1 MAG: hypothetical protein DKM50_08285 [Candidatus Margulisiibacteriota bacterium]HAR63225.1 hypothetical protein [Candidatus Margulisiibacteriota bacterium]HCY37301.1 hypothetical protein [Candidatus Margulisiibacteriota bacterium]